MCKLIEFVASTRPSAFVSDANRFHLKFHELYDFCLNSLDLCSISTQRVIPSMLLKQFFSACIVPFSSLSVMRLMCDAAQCLCTAYIYPCSLSLDVVLAMSGFIYCTGKSCPHCIVIVLPW
jgi:hypothetical protein